MRVINRLSRGLLFSLLLALTSCGGSGGTLAEGGIGGTGISTGPITGFGSIFVNGVEYDTRTAAVIIEGEAAGTGDAAVLNNLAVGKVVTVTSDVPTGMRATATQVSFDDNVEGPLETITVVDADTVELAILGQTVIAESDTRFENTTLGALAVGNQLEVSGLLQQNGAIKATFIEKKSDTFVDGGAVEVKGMISDLNASDRTFLISAVAVDYSSADLSELDGPLANGATVEVKGVYSGGVLTATRIESEDELDIDASTSWLEIQGYVSNVASSSQFVLNGVTVRIDSSTRFSGGAAADIVVGTHIEVEGSYSGDILTASEIKFYDDTSIEAKVDSVGASSLTLTSIAGVTVTANSLTEIDGAASSLAGIDSGHFVKIIGRWSAGGNTVIARKIEVENPSSTIEVKVRGPLTAVADPFVSLLGASIDTTGASYRDAAGTTVSAGRFFAEARVGAPASLEGRQDNATNALTWTRVSLQDDND